MQHIPVLLEEVIEMLDLKNGQIVIDATLGGGGHTEKILKEIGPEGKVIAIDLDKKAIDENKKRFLDYKSQIFFVNDNFVNLESILEKTKIKKVDVILADLGWRIDQVKDGKYGMSFEIDGPLDMRMNANSSQELTAEKIINDWDGNDLVKIFKKYGEERFSNIAVKSITSTRKKKRIKTTGELAKILEKRLGQYYRNKKINPATKIFQALRIVVNQELENLEKFLPQALDGLIKGGYLAIITFNSLEDRIVKKFFQTNARGCICPKEFPICNCGQEPKIEITNSKPIIPGENELSINPRSRSAKLRVVQKI